MNDPYDFDPADVGESPAGKYLAAGSHDPVTVTAHELGESGNGNPQISVTFTGPGGKTHREFYSLLDTARWRLAALFTACGWTSRIQLSKPGLVKQAIYGKPLAVVLRDETFAGKTFPKVKDIRASNKSVDTSGPDEAPAYTDEEIPF